MSDTIDLSKVVAGFRDPVLDSQATFRQAMDAMSQPGRINAIDLDSAPNGLNLATAALVLCLMDYDTPVYLSDSLKTDDITNWIRFHCNAAITNDTAEAAFAILDHRDGWPALSAFNPGDPKYPDTSATLVLQVEGWQGGEKVSLSGPGIKDQTPVEPVGMPAGFWEVRAENVADFQLGLDFFLTHGSQLMGLPRTTRYKKA